MNFTPDQVDFWRQLDLFDPQSFKRQITVVGAGHIGSWLVWTLAKMGCRRITAFDGAAVTEDDLQYTPYGPDDIGRPRVEVLQELVRDAIGTEITAVAEDFGPDSITKDRYKSGLAEGVFFSVPDDSLEQRQEIWNAVQFNFDVPLLVDVRTGGPGGVMYAIEPMRPQHCEKYEETLAEDKIPVGQAAVPTAPAMAGLACFPLIELSKDQPFRNLVRLSTPPLPQPEEGRETTLDTPVTVIGAGALGSYVVMLLAKIGYRNITVWDFDRIESHNLPNQIFGLTDMDTEEEVTDDQGNVLGELKVEALRRRVLKATGIEITAVPEKYEGGDPPEGIFMTMVDSMKFRRQFWDTTVGGRPEVRLLVEARMGIRHGLIYAVDPMNAEQGAKYGDPKVLYDDKDAEESACSNRAIAPSVVTLSSIATFAAAGINTRSTDRKTAAQLNRDGALASETLVNMSPCDIVAKPWSKAPAGRSPQADRPKGDAPKETGTATTTRKRAKAARRR